MSIWTNWDPLEEVIVGDTCVPDSLPEFVGSEAADILGKIFEETKEDLDNLASVLSNLGVKVYRPNVTKYSGPVDLSNFKMKFPVTPLVPRDQYLAYGNTIYQTYTSMPDRYLDSVNYTDIFREKFDEGYNWISQPPPKLKTIPDGVSVMTQGKTIYGEQLADQVIWHTATMFKCGDALVVNDKGPGTARGLEWMRRNMHDTRFIGNKGTTQDGWGHIDHGFFMVDDDTVFCHSTDFVPECLRDKNIIAIGKLDQKWGLSMDAYAQVRDQEMALDDVEKLRGYLQDWIGYDQIVAFDYNVLVVDPKNIITANVPDLMLKALSHYGVNVHVCKMRHKIFWEGSIHCCTLDLKRKGQRRTIIKP